MTKQLEVTRTRPIAEVYSVNDSEIEPSKLIKLSKFGGAVLLAGGLAFGGMFAGETHTAPSEKEPTSRTVDVFGKSSLHVVGAEFEDGRELTYGKDGNNTLRFPDGSEYTHHKDDSVKFGMSKLRVEPVTFGESKLRVVDIPHPEESGQSNLRVVHESSSNTEGRKA